jgi:hypothetical protein
MIIAKHTAAIASLPKLFYNLIFIILIVSDSNRPQVETSMGREGHEKPFLPIILQRKLFCA